MPTPDLRLRRTLRRQLSAYFPPSELEGPFAAEGDVPLLESTFRLVDAGVRAVAPAALAHAGHPEAAEGLRALSRVIDRPGALTTMMMIEKVAHRTQGPSAFIRAVGGVPSSSVLVADAERALAEERIERAIDQFCGAISRMVGMAEQLGTPTEALLDPLRAALSEATSGT